jgi:hypothetical protein
MIKARWLCIADNTEISVPERVLPGRAGSWAVLGGSRGAPSSWQEGRALSRSPHVNATAVQRASHQELALG